MSKLTVLDVRDMLALYFKKDDSLIMSNAINRNNNKSIGVFAAPESRMGDISTFGGDTLAPVTPFPLNILVRWTEDSDVCEKKANELYAVLKSIGENFYVRDAASTKVAFIRMLDSHPVWLGRDKDNVCEYSIRIDVFYYHN